jgi:hypothetical protein
MSTSVVSISIAIQVTMYMLGLQRWPSMVRRTWLGWGLCVGLGLGVGVGLGLGSGLGSGSGSGSGLGLASAHGRALDGERAHVKEGRTKGR